MIPTSHLQQPLQHHHRCFLDEIQTTGVSFIHREAGTKGVENARSRSRVYIEFKHPGLLIKYFDLFESQDRELLEKILNASEILKK